MDQQWLPIVSGIGALICLVLYLRRRRARKLREFKQHR
jgi:hypothetical protein